MSIIDKVSVYEQAVNKGSSIYMDANDLLDIYDYYVDHQRELDAEACLHTALRIHPDNEDVLVTYAIFLRSLGKREAAYKVVKGIENQDAPDVLIFYGENELNKANIEKAERYFDAIPEDVQPYQWRLQYDVAQVYFDYGFYQKANIWLDKCDNPQNPEFRQVLELRAKICYNLGQYSKAEQFMNKSIDLNPYDEMSWIYLSEIQLKLEKYDKVIESTEYALVINADAKQAIRNKLLALLNRDDAYDCTDALNYYLSLQEGMVVDISLLCILVEKMMNFAPSEIVEKMIISALENTSVNSLERHRLLSYYCYILIDKGELSNSKQVVQSLCINGENYQAVMYDYVLRLLSKGYVDEAMLCMQEVIDNDTFDNRFAGLYAMEFVRRKCFEPAKFFWERVFSEYECINEDYTYALAMAAHELKSSKLADIIEHVKKEDFLAFHYFSNIYNVYTWEEVVKKAKNEAETWKK